MDVKATVTAALEAAEERKAQGKEPRKKVPSRNTVAHRKAAKGQPRGRKPRHPHGSIGDRPREEFWKAAPGPLTPRGTVGPGAASEARSEMRKAVRKASAVDLMDRGYTYQQIAAHLGCSTYTVAKDIEEAYVELSNYRLDKIEHRRLLEIRRSERLDRKLNEMLDDKSKNVRLQAAARLLANADFRAKLDGLHARPDGTYTQEEVMAMVVGMTRDLVGAFLSPDDRRRIAQVVKQRVLRLAPAAMPEIERGVIDVTPEPEPADTQAVDA